MHPIYMEIYRMGDLRISYKNVYRFLCKKQFSLIFAYKNIKPFFKSMSLYYIFKAEEKTQIRRLLIFMEIREISIVLFVSSGSFERPFFKRPIIKIIPYNQKTY